MSPGAYLAGCAVLVGIFAPAAYVGVLARRRLGVEAGPLARLVEAVTALTMLLLLVELLGTVGWLRPAPLVLAGVGLAGAARLLVARVLATSPPTGGDGWAPARRGETAVAALAAAVVVAAYGARAAATLSRGIHHVDSLYYHLPKAARFVQDGSVWPLYVLEQSPLVALFPANYEALLALVLMPFSRDFPVPAVNIGWLTLALLAAWCAGRRRGAPGLAVLGAAAVLVTPQLIVTQAGNADSDVAAIALSLAALALFIEAPGQRGFWLLGGAAAGLAVAVKLDTLLLMLVLGVAAAARGQGGGRGAAARWFAGLTATAAYWPLRNLALTGSPLLTTRLQVGGVGFPYIAPPDQALRRSVAQYLGQGYFWEHVVPTALGAVMGPGWLLLVATTLAAAGLLLWSRERAAVAGAAGALATLGLYVVTPGSAYTFPGNFAFPSLFGANTRYLLPAMAMLLVLLPGAVLRLHHHAGRALLVLYGLLFVLPQLGWDVKWNVWRSPTAVQLAAGGALGLLALAAVVFAPRVSRLAPRPRLALAAALALGLLVLGLGAADINARQRYRDLDVANGPLYGWGRDLVGAHVGVMGFGQPFPFFGPDLSNRVDYIGAQDGHGVVAPYLGCAEWRRGVNAALFDYLVVGPAPDGSAAPTRWTAADPAATAVMRSGQVTVFRVRGRLDPAHC